MIDLLYAENKYFYKETYFLMDNLNVHYAKFFSYYFKNKGIKLIFTSPYSPELNSIELYFNTLK